MNNLGRNIAIWVIIGASLIALFNIFQSNDQVSNNRNVAYSDFMTQVENGNIKEVVIEGNNLKGLTKENAIIKSYKPDGADVISEEHKSH